MHIRMKFAGPQKITLQGTMTRIPFQGGPGGEDENFLPLPGFRERWTNRSLRRVVQVSHEKKQRPKTFHEILVAF